MTTHTGTHLAAAPAMDCAAEWSELEVCDALYWLRRARRRDDAAMVRVWTHRMDALLDWKLENTTVADGQP
jgi:hypothetical protein